MAKSPTQLSETRRMTTAAYALPRVPSSTIGFGSGHAPSSPNEEELRPLTPIARQFLDRFKAPPFRGDRAAWTVGLQGGVGYADVAKGELLTPTPPLRSRAFPKPVTSRGYFLFHRAGKLRLEDLIFGSAGCCNSIMGRAFPGNVGEITLAPLAYAYRWRLG